MIYDFSRGLTVEGFNALTRHQSTFHDQFEPECRFVSLFENYANLGDELCT